MTDAVAIDSWVPQTREFGARLALIRWQMRWNIKEAALACALPPQSWRTWELTGSLPRDIVEVATRISERTGCDFMWLLTGRGEAGGRGPQSGVPVPTHYKAMPQGVVIDSSRDLRRTVPLREPVAA